MDSAARPCDDAHMSVTRAAQVGLARSGDRPRRSSPTGCRSTASARTRHPRGPWRPSRSRRRSWSPGSSRGPGGPRTASVRSCLRPGFALLFRQLRYSHDSFLFTFFFALGDLGYALVASRRARLSVRSWCSTGFERAARPGGLRAVLAFPLAVMLSARPDDRSAAVPDSTREPSYRAPAPHRLAGVLQQTYLVVFFGVLAALFLVLVSGGSPVLGSRRARGVRAPLLFAAAVRRRAPRGVRVGRDVRRRITSAVEDSALFWLSAVIRLRRAAACCCSPACFGCFWRAPARA